MRPKKLDRWERMANTFFAHEGPFYAVEIADLLRKEHRAVVRLIKKEFRRSTTYYRSSAMVLKEILDQLKRRAK